MASAEVGGASTSTSVEATELRPEKEAAEMVQEFYAAINRREIASIGELFADDCVYEDLVFPKPFLGRKAILEFFQKFMNSVGSELEFRVDDITTGDPNAAGVIWHLDWNGKPLPFSKGCSFYRCQVLNGKRQFVYGRDAVEPATKPGDFTLVALKGLAALLRRFPSLAERF
jgi:ketosteroid isomerase-like protein